MANTLKSVPMDKPEMEYRARDALHTIGRAEEHRRDPELMKHVRRLADTQMKAVTGANDMKKMEKSRPNTGKDPKLKGKVPVAKAQGPKDRGPSKIEMGKKR